MAVGRISWVGRATSLLDDPAHWRTRAAEARAIASEMKDPEAKRTMIEVATHYDVLAERAARRGRDKF